MSNISQHPTRPKQLNHDTSDDLSASFFFRRLYDLSWLVVGQNPSEKYEFVNWDDEIPKISGKIKN